MTTEKSTKENTLAANILVHGILANSGEYQKSVHFLPENQKKVRQLLLGLLGGTPQLAVNGVAIDFGCGTGFLIDLIHDLFSEIHGVDITTDMMKHVQMHNGKVHLHECRAEETPFPDNHFDFASAYSFMDHLFDFRAFLVEAFRVLKPGGIFYADLNPNRSFIKNIERVSDQQTARDNPIVYREIQGALHNGLNYQEKYGLDADALEAAEPIKTRDHGFEASEVLRVAGEVGFSSCQVEYEWFLGQAKVMHEQSAASAQLVDAYLRMTLPASAHLYKYLRFVFRK
jgi:SAM-dependent methyltransferase